MRARTQTFVEHYNKKHPEHTLDVAETHLEGKSNKALPSSTVFNRVFSDTDDVYVKSGAPPPAPVEPEPELAEEKPAAATAAGAAAGGSNGSSGSSVLASASATGGGTSGGAAATAGRIRCKNFGCNQFFTEAENSDTACRHHVKPPVFHDTKKGWSCCPKRVYDWDEFQQLAGCTVGRHSAVPPAGPSIAASPTVAAAAAAGGASSGSGGSGGGGAGAAVKDISSWNTANPEAATAAGSAAKSVAKRKQRPAPRADGKAKCVNPGCQQLYDVAGNSATACRYHAGAPVFHDRAKYWSCCPKKAYDFDAFMALPRCMTGPHRDFIPDEEEQEA